MRLPRHGLPETPQQMRSLHSESTTLKGGKHLLPISTGLQSILQTLDRGTFHKLPGHTEVFQNAPTGGQQTFSADLGKRGPCIDEVNGYAASTQQESEHTSHRPSPHNDDGLPIHKAQAVAKERSRNSEPAYISHALPRRNLPLDVTGNSPAGIKRISSGTRLTDFRHVVFTRS